MYVLKIGRKDGKSKKYLMFMQHLNTKYSKYTKCTGGAKYSSYIKHVWGIYSSKYIRSSKYSGCTKYLWVLNIQKALICHPSVTSMLASRKTNLWLFDKLTASYFYGQVLLCLPLSHWARVCHWPRIPFVWVLCLKPHFLSL